MHAFDTIEEAYQHLAAYTLTRGDATFIHQHVVDAWAVQYATPESKPIAVAFGLAGLCLHLERGFTGREVQLAHIEMARERKPWPRFPLPAGRGAMTALDVMAMPAGPERDRAIDAWCVSVWEAFHDSHEQVRAMLAEHLPASRQVARAPGVSHDSRTPHSS